MCICMYMYTHIYICILYMYINIKNNLLRRAEEELQGASQ